MTEQQSDWQISRLRNYTVEIKNANRNELKYILRATKADVRVQAVENDEVLEEMYVTRAMHEIILESVDGPKLMRLAIKPGMDTTTGYVMLDDEEFVVESPSSEHGIRLIGELKKRSPPSNERLKVLISGLRSERKLLDEVKRHTSFGPSIMTRSKLSNGVVAGCVTVCVVCAWGHFPACVGCAICVEM